MIFIAKRNVTVHVKGGPNTLWLGDVAVFIGERFRADLVPEFCTQIFMAHNGNVGHIFFSKEHFFDEFFDPL